MFCGEHVYVQPSVLLVYNRQNATRPTPTIHSQIPQPCQPQYLPPSTLPPAKTPPPVPLPSPPCLTAILLTTLSTTVTINFNPSSTATTTSAQLLERV